jgi:PKD repeat protein
MSQAFRFAFALVLISLIWAAPVFADATSEYGEVERFGGFDSSAYNSGHYGGSLTSGKFVDPTGFTVNPQDNTVYVVDRTSSYQQEPTSSWRIQKFSSTGEVQGTTTFSLPNTRFGASAVVGLAVDSRAGRLYALVIGSPPLSSPYPQVTVAQEIVAWSTTPNASNELVAAPGLGRDDLGTTGGLVSSQEQLQPSGSTLLYYPQGIVIDRLEKTGVDNPVAIEASDLSPQGRGTGIQGDTIVQQIATQASEGKGTGAPLANWSSASVAATLDGSWGPLGISANPDGTISVGLEASNLSATDAYIVKLSPDLTDPVVLNGDTDDPPLGKGVTDIDEAALWLDGPPDHSVAGVTVSNTAGAGAEFTQLSTTTSDNEGGLYAADIFFAGQDYQNHGGSPYWAEGYEPNDYVSNLGVRLLQPAADGAIASPTGGTIVNTLGNKAAGGACNIGAPEAALASGADGTLWVFDRGPASKVYSPDSKFAWTGVGVGREIIELAPGAEFKPGAEQQLCPQPSGTFTMEPAGESSQSDESQVEVPAGTKVTFNASSVLLKGGKPFAYEWDLDGNPNNGSNGEGYETINEMKRPYYEVPTALAGYTYTKPGTYEVRLRIRSDYGFYMQSAKVIVTGQSISGPQAQFTVLSAVGSQQVTVDAAGSTGGGGSIAYYIWNWGDGDIEEESPQSPVASHVYASPGKYEITLTVVNSSYLAITSAPQTAIVEASQPVVRSPLDGPLYEIPVAPESKVSPPAASHPTDVSPHASYTRGVIDVRLFCPKTRVLCAGVVQVQTAVAVAGKRRRVKSQKLQLGHASFSLASGAYKTLAIRVSARGMALLSKLKRLPALIVVTAHDPSGNPGTAILRLTLAVANGRGRSGSSHKHR